MKPIDALLLGAGMRGTIAYGPYALQFPQQLNFVAVAEPNRERRERFARLHNIAPEYTFADWQEALQRPQLAAALFNCTQDGMHYQSTRAALAAGYDVLLEKPMTPTLAETVRLVQLAEQHGRLLQICHVLRYTRFFDRLHEIITSGALGEIVTVTHRENLRYTHMAHSYVRGHWRNSAASSPMILAKCCHDFDILHWNLKRPVVQLQSFGALIHFRPQNAPANASERCTDPCPAADDCPFDARRFYLQPQDPPWAVAAISDDLSPSALQHALQVGPYGRCVYRCDNDVVDQQTVSMVYDNGATAVLVMQGHGHEEARTMRYDGTRATLRGKFSRDLQRIEIHDHLSDQTQVIDFPAAASGHGGGDFGVVARFVATLQGKQPRNDARHALESHLLAFAAERSRLQQQVVAMNPFRAAAESAAAQLL